MGKACSKTAGIDNQKDVRTEDRRSSKKLGKKNIRASIVDTKETHSDNGSPRNSYWSAKNSLSQSQDTHE